MPFWEASKHPECASTWCDSRRKARRVRPLGERQSVAERWQFVGKHNTAVRLQAEPHVQAPGTQRRNPGRQNTRVQDSLTFRHFTDDCTRSSLSRGDSAVLMCLPPPSDLHKACRLNSLVGSDASTLYGGCGKTSEQTQQAHGKTHS